MRFKHTTHFIITSCETNCHSTKQAIGEDIAAQDQSLLRRQRITATEERAGLSRTLTWFKYARHWSMLSLRQKCLSLKLNSGKPGEGVRLTSPKTVSLSGLEFREEQEV